MKSEKRKNIHSLAHNEHLKDAFYQTRAACATDCTGITPIVPDSDYEADSYESLMEVPVTARHKEKTQSDIEFD